MCIIRVVNGVNKLGKQCIYFVGKAKGKLDGKYGDDCIENADIVRKSGKI